VRPIPRARGSATQLERRPAGSSATLVRLVGPRRNRLLQFTRNLDMAEARTIERRRSSDSDRRSVRSLAGLPRCVLEVLWDTGWATVRCARRALKRVRNDGAS
jgi:hypothetical protein